FNHDFYEWNNALRGVRCARRAGTGEHRVAFPRLERSVDVEPQRAVPNRSPVPTELWCMVLDQRNAKHWKLVPGQLARESGLDVEPRPPLGPGVQLVSAAVERAATA